LASRTLLSNININFRQGVKEAISLCKSAGVKIIMITTDQELSAISIAKQVGILDNVDDLMRVMKDREKNISIEDAEKRSNVSFY
jgi:Ca2+-transporting ATPase